MLEAEIGNSFMMCRTSQDIRIFIATGAVTISVVSSKHSTAPVSTDYGSCSDAGNTRHGRPPLHLDLNIVDYTFSPNQKATRAKRSGQQDRQRLLSDLIRWAEPLGWIDLSWELRGGQKTPLYSPNSSDVDADRGCLNMNAEMRD
ncbi:hypothetical protein N7463_001623 [Penicillium fimorum]|uniref:Uncharacterized protein n=1 Tax=Penicillium fimorum TaxID=1882269 RepID=A0A9W9XXJ4_9EURO|nr:hypothetical protein N7463_001623 [Penicillium fimorum]